MTDSKPATPNKISKETAELQINGYLTQCRVRLSNIEIENGQDAAQTMINGLVEAIQEGVLEIVSEDGKYKVIQTLIDPIKDVKTLEYGSKIIKARLAMDRVSENKSQTRMLEFMAAITNTPASVLMNMSIGDAAIFNRIAMIFSMV